MPAKSMVALSGGMDSATLLWWVQTHVKGEIEAVGFDYGSKHGTYEQHAAKFLSDEVGVPYTLFNLKPVMLSFRSNLLMYQGEVPEGHYQEESMRQTVVPGRNLIFLSVLAGFAESRKCDSLWIGVHAGDHFIYPDCRPDFIRHASEAIKTSSDGKLDVQAPFLHYTKADILRTGMGLSVPYHLTRTCYKPQPVACGKCGSCQERLEAFNLLGTEDPIRYESRELLPKSS